ncbi:MAG: hypothetical protein JG769_1217 [Oscillospiraceae bacterium]|jgi:septum formation protein|nr:hypothetical protein [Oscillospiraceae bacterium]
MEIILASASPRRQELLKLIFPQFEIFPADVDETLPAGLPAEKCAEYLAEKKAKKVSGQFPDALVIGCDTIVVCKDKILGKPMDKDEAFNMLSFLSGKIHKVITGVCICFNGETKVFSEITEVEFYPLSDTEITSYIETGEPFDKAGAYGIQGKGALFVKGICGDFFNVVGLPVSRLKKELEVYNGDF